MENIVSINLNALGDPHAGEDQIKKIRKRLLNVQQTYIMPLKAQCFTI